MGLFDRIRDHKRNKPTTHNSFAPPSEKPNYPAEPTRDRLPIRSSTISPSNSNSVPSGSYSKKPLEARDQEELDKKKAEEVARCSKLLRQMYTLDLRIWGMQSAVGKKEIQEREDLKQRANALFNEVNRVVSGWSGQMNYDRWSPEEQRAIRNIYKVLNEHDRQTY